MKCLKDNTGAVFDVAAAEAERIQDVFDHEVS
jgi:hypothetical protein